MTIGVGFKCIDGIVLSSDTQITWPQMHKYYECKLYGHRQHEWTVIFTFAGSPTLMKSFNGKFADAMRLMPAPHSVAKIKDLVETVLLMFDSLKDNPTDLCLLCAITVRDELFALFKTEGHTIFEVTGYDYVGVGDSSLLRYLGPLLTEPSDERPYGYKVRHAAILGTYLVMKAKTHIDGCGGDTDTWILRPSGQWEVKDGGSIYRIEQTMLGIEFQIRKAAANFFDKRVTDEEFEKRIYNLNRLVKEAHFEFRIPVD